MFPNFVSSCALAGHMWGDNHFASFFSHDFPWPPEVHHLGLVKQGSFSSTLLFSAYKSENNWITLIFVSNEVSDQQK